MALTKVGKEGITGVSNSSDATAITIGSSEDIGIGVSPESDHYSPYVNINFGLTGLLGSAASGTNTTFLTNNAYLDTSANWIYKETDEASKYNQVSGTHVWEYAASGSAGGTISFSEAMRIDNSGRLLIGTTTYNNANVGVLINSATGLVFATASGDAPVKINRKSSDGELVELLQDTNKEGSLSVSGSTVTLVGFSGQHESSGIATNTAVGTVVSTIDELDTYASGDKKGQTRADHPKVKVSDTEGDKAVYGVVDRFNSDDKVIVSAVGIASIKVTGACAKGDLLESNGDGTAKVQSDDIVRSKTIGKVTIGNSSTDVKLVSCVLYCG